MKYSIISDRIDAATQTSPEKPVITSKLSSSADRVKAYRKRKAEADPSFEAKESKRVADLRRVQRCVMNTEQLEAARKKGAERVAKYRMKKKLEQEKEPAPKTPRKSKGTGFKSPQSLGKAVNKLLVKMPFSPSKNKAVLGGIAKRIGIELVEKMNNNLSGKPSRGLTEEVKQLVKDFFFRPDI